MNTSRPASLNGPGARIFTGLLAIYYAVVLLSSAHNTVVQLLSLWGLVLVFLPSYRAPLERDELRLILVMFSLFAAALLSYLVNGLWAEPGANLSRYARFLLFAPIFLVARRFASARGFWQGLLVGAMVVGVWSVLEFAGLARSPVDRFPSVSGAVNQIQYGDLSLTLAVMTAAGLPVYRRYGRDYLVAAILAVGLDVFGCLGAEVRGAWIAIPALGALVCWSYLRNGFLRWRHLAGIVVAGSLGVALVLPHTNVVSRARAPFAELHEYQQGVVAPSSSAGFRLEMWRAAWEVFRSHPVVGAGPGLYTTRVRELPEVAERYKINVVNFSHPHSEYFFVIATLGVAGLVALALLWLFPLWRFFRAALSADLELQALGLAGAALIVAYMHFGLTEALLFQHATFLGFYLISVAVLATLVRQRQAELMKETTQ